MAECFQPREITIYDHLWDVEAVSAATLKGDCAVVQDVFGFYIKDAESATEEICFVFECRQVQARKLTGTNEDIHAGDRLYYQVAQDAVSPNTGGGAAGTDYYPCGFALKDAAASATSVLMKFDGTRYNETI